MQGGLKIMLKFFKKITKIVVDALNIVSAIGIGSILLIIIPVTLIFNEQVLMYVWGALGISTLAYIISEGLLRLRVKIENW
jgi:hypothetical protein